MLGCVSSGLNRFTIKKVIPAMMAGSDLDMACSFGGTVTSGVEAALAKRPSKKALVLSSGASGICAELAAREAKLEGQVIMKNHVALGPAMAAEANDARIRAQRLELPGQRLGADAPRAAAAVDAALRHQIGKLGRGRRRGRIGAQRAAPQEKSHAHGCQCDRLVVVAATNAAHDVCGHNGHDARREGTDGP